jgi:hypothetical protein
VSTTRHTLAPPCCPPLCPRDNLSCLGPEARLPPWSCRCFSGGADGTTGALLAKVMGWVHTQTWPPWIVDAATLLLPACVARGIRWRCPESDSQIHRLRRLISIFRTSSRKMFSIIVAVLASIMWGAVLAGNVQAGCVAPPPGIPFAFPASTFTTAVTSKIISGSWNSGEDVYSGEGTGLQLVDLNGDTLVDIFWAYEYDDGSAGPTVVQCIFLNTGCGWVAPSNYTGPETWCMPHYAIQVRNVEFPFRGMQVNAFKEAVAEEFGLAPSSVEVTLASGVRAAHYSRMVEDVAIRGPFSVSVAGEIAQYVPMKR